MLPSARCTCRNLASAWRAQHDESIEIPMTEREMRVDPGAENAMPEGFNSFQYDW